MYRIYLVDPGRACAAVAARPQKPPVKCKEGGSNVGGNADGAEHRVVRGSAPEGLVHGDLGYFQFIRHVKNVFAAVRQTANVAERAEPEGTRDLARGGIDAEHPGGSIGKPLLLGLIGGHQHLPFRIGQALRDETLLQLRHPDRRQNSAFLGNGADGFRRIRRGLSLDFFHRKGGVTVQRQKRPPEPDHRLDDSHHPLMRGGVIPLRNTDAPESSTAFLARPGHFSRA